MFIEMGISVHLGGGGVYQKTPSGPLVRPGHTKDLKDLKIYKRVIKQVLVLLKVIYLYFCLIKTE